MSALQLNALHKLFKHQTLREPKPWCNDRGIYLSEGFSAFPPSSRSHGKQTWKSSSCGINEKTYVYCSRSDPIFLSIAAILLCYSERRTKLVPVARGIWTPHPTLQISLAALKTKMAEITIFNEEEKMGSCEQCSIY